MKNKRPASINKTPQQTTYEVEMQQRLAYFEGPLPAPDVKVALLKEQVDLLYQGGSSMCQNICIGALFMAFPAAVNACVAAADSGLSGATVFLNGSCALAGFAVAIVARIIDHNRTSPSQRLYQEIIAKFNEGNTAN